jgi:four helix bundle protein
MATIKSFEDLEIWQLSRTLCQNVCEIMTETNLKSDYKLKKQINGSSGSIMDNIAEGFERDGNKEFHNFLSIAKGSGGETRSQLYRIFDRNYIDEEKFNELKNKSLVISQKTKAFMKYIEKDDYRGLKFKKEN